jgi:hypothetical protein
MPPNSVPPGDSSYTVAASARLGASAGVVYGIIADYRHGHPTILPPKYFRGLEVLEGGVGAGTRIRFEMGALGKWRTALADVTEPRPGRLLHEFYPDTGILTTFTVEPSGEAACAVTIATVMPGRAGLGGLFERWVVPRYLRAVYREELALLARRANAGFLEYPLS